MVEVVAALIWENDRFLICQRPANKARPLLWEYVGGKVEPGETKEDALVRECKEELGIDLITLFSALKYGVYYLASDGQLIHDYVSLTNNYINVGAHDKLSYSFMTFLEKRTLLFTDYSKTWALTKEELEGNKNGN